MLLLLFADQELLGLAPQCPDAVGCISASLLYVLDGQ